MRPSEKSITMTTAVRKNQDVEERERLIAQLLDAVKQVHSSPTLFSRAMIVPK